MYKKRLLISVASISFILLLGIGLLINATPQEAASVEAKPSVDSNILESINSAFVDIAKVTNPAIVNITTTVTAKGGLRRGSSPQQDPLWEEFWRRFSPEQPRNQQPEEEYKREGPSGSGFIVKPNGYILTNHHVIDNADKIKVILNDKQEFEAELVGTDRETEVAVIKIDAEDLPTIEMGNSDELQVGEIVLAIGNPFGLSHTVTNGIVSATGRSGVLNRVTYQDFIQTNAAINPGNSGGPLVNIRSEVVGINTAIALATTATGMPIRGNVGVGFAIPINMARDVMEQLIDKGEVVRGWLGIRFQDGLISKDMAKKFGLDEPAGSLILIVAGPAKDAGLKRGDLIIEFNGEAIADNTHLQKLVAAAKPDDTVKIKAIRGNKEKDFKVKLGQRTDEALAKFGGMRPGSIEEKEEDAWVGITVQELTEEIAQRLGYESQEGVLISGIKPGSLASEVSDPPKSGDLIQEIEFEEIKNIGDYRKAIKDANIEEGVMLMLRRPGKGPWYILIKK